MKFMLLCYDDTRYWQDAGEAAHRAAMNEAVQLTHELKAKGQYVTASPLHSTSTAKSVRVREGNPVVTDGPFVETREHLGGYYIIDAKDMNDAIAIAARHPGARHGGVEIRPIFELPGLPPDGFGATVG